MKLATHKDGTRDGQLLVVSRDLTSAHYATGIANTLQQTLDDWNFYAPQLQDLYVSLNQGRARHGFAFEPARCMAPLPRAHQLVVGAGYARPSGPLADADPPDGPDGPDAAPSMRQACSDDFLGPCDDLLVPSDDLGIDFSVELVAAIGDVPVGTTPEQAIDRVRLLMLANGVSLCHPMPAELALGFGPYHSQVATGFAPVAVTPDELGAAWQGGRAQLMVQSTWNSRTVGNCDAAADMAHHFGQLIAHMAATRRVRAGSLLSSGTVRNRSVFNKTQPEWPHGHASIADLRTSETLRDGSPTTTFMACGDSIRIEAKTKDGASVFGAIHQKVEPMDGNFP